MCLWGSRLSLKPCLQGYNGDGQSRGLSPRGISGLRVNVSLFLHRVLLLIQSSSFSGVIPLFQSLHCDQIGWSPFFSFLFLSLMTYLAEVETDAEGISSDSLRFILENWAVGKPKPKVLYTVPVSYFRTLHDAHQRSTTNLFTSVVRLQSDRYDCDSEAPERSPSLGSRT